ncbi:MAG TPA: response regulator [Vicinamibacteria bacterium]|nr:response regulator [Vicinamibacteria bacterium]
MPHVLVAEDSSDDRDVFKTALEIGGFTVTTTETTAGLLEAAWSASPPDVILLDLVLVRDDGLDVVRTLREDARTALLPIVAITAATPLYVEETALKVGCTAFLTKPCHPEVIFATLRSAVRGREA